MDGSYIINFAAFTLVKLVGYSIAGYYLNKRYQVQNPNPFVFGLLRTIIGIAAGLTVLFITTTNKDISLHLMVLVPVRFAEWFIMIWFSYERVVFSFQRIAGYSILGVLYSFLLDLPAIIAAFLGPGDMSFC